MNQSPRRKWPAALAAAAILSAGIGAWFLRAERAPGAASPAADASAHFEATFIGSNQCAECHAEVMQGWRGSQHSQAMQHANEQTVLGDFDSASFTYAGVTSSFSRRDGKYYIRTDGPDGELTDYEVKYTFGVAPLQQYLVELPGGRLQAVSVTWDTRPRESGGQRWFRQYPDEAIDHRDELHWTSRAQNWNFMCADCHSTDVRKNYDAPTNSFKTAFSEISVGCEACHGPGSAHVAWARQPDDSAAKGLTVRLDERRGVTWSVDPGTGKPRRSAPRTTEREIDVCAQCHARRSQIAEGYRAGLPFGDHYLPSPLSPALYHADGQQQDEVFIWGSWQQSKMHRAGVTCSDCHDPHTQQLRAPGNTVCAQCHDASRYDAAAHHHHAPGSAGAQCADCHMPRTTYMVVDPRRDHSMRVPRPDESVALGVPNACNTCHADRDPRWAADAVRGWFGRDATGYESFARAFHSAEQGDPAAIANLAAIAFAADQPGLVRASALEHLANLNPDTELLRRAANDGDWLVRLAAVQMADALPPEARVAALGPLLGDSRRAVRIEAARSLAGQQQMLAEELQPAWQRASEEYLATLRYTADRPEARVALGGFYAALGRIDDAQAAFASAIEFDPSFVPAYVNAADALRASGNDGDAVMMLRRGLEQTPESATLHHALGLAQIRTRQTGAAVRSLQRAAELDPDTARYAYVYAVALHSTGSAPLAIRAMERAAVRWPHDRDVLLALASFQAESGAMDAARRTAGKLIAQYPADRDAQQIAAQLGLR